MTKKILSQRHRYLLVTTATLLPIVSLLLIVFYTSYRPIFLAMEGIVHKSILEIEPLNELQMALMRASMPPNDYLIRGGEEEKQNWQKAKQNVARAFESVHSADIPCLSPSALIEIRKGWERSQDKGDLLFLVKNTECISAANARAMEDFDQGVLNVIGAVARIVDKLQNDVHAHHQEVEQLKLGGGLIVISAIILGLVTGVAGSIWLTRARRKIVDLTLQDPLTKIFNRRALEARLEKMHKEHAADANDDYSVLMLDIDHFKLVNDRYGHDAGDLVLQEFARLIDAMIRSQDVFGRYGGEEFLVLLPHTGHDNAVLLAERIRRAVETNPIKIAHRTNIHVTVSIGCASLSGTDDDPQQVVQASDMAMYKAKKAGRNRVA